MVGDLNFVTLGQMRATRGQAVIDVGPPQRQAMLAMLLLRAGHPVSVPDLIDGLWGMEPPDSAVTTVRTYAWRIRKAFEDPAGQAPILVTAWNGYRLAVPTGVVDAVQAEALAAEAARARAAEQLAEAGALLDQALLLWQGEPLGGVPGPYAERQRTRLDELRLALLEERFENEIDLGRHALAIPELTALIAQYPLRERLYGLLMRALYNSGRQVEALTVFSGVRRLLVSEQGIDPGPGLLTLHRRILESDPTLSAALERMTVPVSTRPEDRTAAAAGGAEPPPPVPAPPVLPVPAQLPPDIADFTGRRDLVGQICAALTAPGREAPVVAAVTGMGGVGKTTLALHAARRVCGHFPDGQLYADLRGAVREPDPGIVLAGFLAALGIAAEAIPDTLEERSGLYRSVLDGRRVLIVLDGAVNAAQVRPLVPGGATAAVLTTSRAQLFGLPLDLQVGLDVFGPDEALELLSRVVGADRLAAEPDAGRRLVEACGHLPLAVRIVASRLASRRGWTIASMIDRLADERGRITELRIGDLAIEAVFELGYHQLTARHARAFRTLAATDGPDIGLYGAAAVLGTDLAEAEQLLESLVDAAMLESPAVGRYRYHDLLRSFARQQVSEQEPDEAERAHARWLSHLLSAAADAFRYAVPGDPVGTVLDVSEDPSPSRAGPGFTDLRGARAWAAAECAGVAAAVERTVRSVTAAGRGDLRRATALLIALSPFGRDLNYGLLARAAHAAAEAADRLGDAQSVGRARFICGNNALQVGRLAEAEYHSRLAVAACRAAGDTAVLRQTLNDLGLVALYLRRYDEAVACYDEAITLARKLGHRAGEVVTIVNAALARVRSGRCAEAVEACESVLAGQADQVGGHDPGVVSYAQYVLGLALHGLGRDAEALDRFSECLARCRAAGIRNREAQALYRMADTLRVLGRLPEAAAYARDAMECAREIASERDQGYALFALGRVLADQGDAGGARARLREARAVFERLDLPEVEDTERLLAKLE